MQLAMCFTFQGHDAGAEGWRGIKTKNLRGAVLCQQATHRRRRGPGVWAQECDTQAEDAHSCTAQVMYQFAVSPR